MEPLTAEEIHKVTVIINTKSPTGTRNHAIFVLALDTGLRASEIAGIKLGRLNLQSGYIKVMGKGAKERIVPIGKFVQMTLWHYIDKARPQQTGGEYDNLFLSPDGRPITVNTIKLVFTRLAKKSGVKRLHTHLCRHTFAINYLLNGGDFGASYHLQLAKQVHSLSLPAICQQGVSVTQSISVSLTWFLRHGLIAGPER